MNEMLYMKCSTNPVISRLSPLSLVCNVACHVACAEKASSVCPAPADQCKFELSSVADISSPQRFCSYSWYFFYLIQVTILNGTGITLGMMSLHCNNHWFCFSQKILTTKNITTRIENWWGNYKQLESHEKNFLLEWDSCVLPTSSVPV